MPSADAIELRIEGRPRDIGDFAVRRTLPAPQRRAVGPFVFVDHIGPADLAPGQGIDVRPHPHIALATITYLIEGEFVHRDTLGSNQVIRPGDVNWMIAGRGIAHSERSDPALRARGGRLHGVQTWVALPRADEEMEPRFEHHPGGKLPRIERPGVRLTVIAGTAYGEEAPTGVRSPTLYVHARLASGAALPVDEVHAERALYVASGEVSANGSPVPVGTLAVLRPGADVRLESRGPADVFLLGGAPLDGPRHIWWNFVSSSPERIERAKADWREGRFGKIPGDELDFIPLPEA
jgi:redox-sensitive bicupin YhaK (pirin superfamily)